MLEALLHGSGGRGNRCTEILAGLEGRQDLFRTEQSRSGQRGVLIVRLHVHHRRGTENVRRTDLFVDEVAALHASEEMSGGDRSAVDQHQGDGRRRRGQHAAHPQPFLNGHVHLVNAVDRREIELRSIECGHFAGGGHGDVEVHDRQDRHPELDPQQHQEILAGDPDTLRAQHDGEGHQRGDRIAETFDPGHHRPHDAGEQVLLAGPLGVTSAGYDALQRCVLL